MTEILNPATLPLQGSRLIEASAGTGKTWTIAALYLRLVLGHGRAQPLLPAQILVMTFTRAATRELSDRIRRRLLEAAARFRLADADASTPDDAFMRRLLADFPEGAARQGAAWRLAMAAAAMDDAAVLTIDAWCQRMLREHAFDSGCLFDEELQANEAAMLAEAARDFWRQQVYPLADEALAPVLALWPDVDALLADLRPLLAWPLPSSPGSLADCLTRAQAEAAQALADLKQGWVERADDMLAWLEAQWQQADGPLNKRSLAEGHARRWLQDLRAWAQDPPAATLDLKTGWQRLSHHGVIEACKPGRTVDPPAAFAALPLLQAAQDELPDPTSALRLHAAAQVAARLQQLKAQSGSYGFADMLQRLHDALDPQRHGARAQQLRQRIVEQYPAAMVDEFQDTSALQLGIFDRLYRIADDDPSTALLLIGDPKQSIYGFRGADIQAYLGARAATRGRQHVLGTNHRSTQALVGAVNHLFERAEQRAGEGAFGFRQGGSNELPFVPVQAAGQARRLVCGGNDAAALSIHLDTVARGKPASREHFAALCAERIVGLLNDAQAGFAQDGMPLQRLQPADIAVLVRTGTEAAAVQLALRRRGVASVYLSDKDSIFASSEAQDLLRLLQAVAAPRDMRLARAALATPLLGLSLPALLQLASEDEAFDARCELLRALGGAWRTQGVLAMLRRALHGFGVPQRSLQIDVGERRLTNVLHLAELLQAASAQVEGEQALIRWLAQQIADAAAGQGGGDEQVLRLESDAELVKVVTVHKSKGLEYPLVFLPFPAQHRAVERRNTRAVRLVGADGQRRLILSPGTAQLDAADHVRLREDLRLLYVALTRARHALWLGAAVLHAGKTCVWQRSAIGCLASGTEQVPPAQIALDLQALADAGSGIALVVDAAEAPPPVTRCLPRAAPPALLPAPAYAAQFDRLWSVSSYSALVRDALPLAAAAPELPLRPLRDDEPAAAEPAPAAAQPWHRFPRGAFAGNFLHDQLEWLAAEGFALAASPTLQQALARRCQRQGWGARSEEVLAWLGRVCSTPLPALGAALDGITRSLPEMEFWFPSDGLRAGAVDALCHQHLLPGQGRPLLPERSLRGLFMGFADLVFEHQGRYWVLDYKSNALGAGDADYTQGAMQAALLSHRYDVQAALYLLALHRLLKSRLGAAYDPARQLGGAIFYFLRGVNSASRGCCLVPPPLALIKALDAMLVATPDVAAGAPA